MKIRTNGHENKLEVLQAVRIALLLRFSGT